MLPSSITAALAFLACASAIAWLVALMREKGLRPARRVGAVFRDQPVAGRVFLAVFAFVFWVVASSKPPAGGNRGVTPVAGDWEGFTPITSTNTTRTLDGDDFRRGFVLARVGTGEAFTFAAPDGANVCADWRAFGAAEDWMYVAFTNWTVQVGTNAVDRLRIHSDGWVKTGTTGVSPVAWVATFWPFHASLGIVPQANWPLVAGNENAAPEDLAPSQFWHFVTPSNTLQLTWQNVLLDRLTNTPVSVQMEVWPSGRFTYRYDLSRCGGLGEPALPDGTVTNILVGACLGGLEWATNSVPTNLTSLAFYPLSPEDAASQDRDGDGLSLLDELFAFGTDPHNPDSDYDGLTDYEELFVHHTDPLAPYSNGGPYSDGFAARIGDLNPFAFPPGSDYTYYEHVVYSGTTNGAVSIPEASASSAVLAVSVSGTGTGDLVVGGQSLPLLGGAPTVSVPVPRGNRLAVRLRRRTGTLQVSLATDDFAIGEMPGLVDGDPSGWVCFPRAVPDPAVACIHDLRERKVAVRIDPGPGAEGLSCLWWGTDAVTASNHADGVSATLVGNFDAHSTARVWYELVHPQHLFGNSYLPQSVRFCPRPADADDEPEDEPGYVPDAPGPDDDLYEPNDGEPDSGCVCCDSCSLSGGGCSCHEGEAPPEVSGPVPESDPDDPPATCPVHNCPYSECEDLHGDDAPRTVRVPSSTRVLTVGRNPTVDTVSLAVPEGAVNCCPCPGHWTNYVGVAYKSDHLAVRDAAGLPFRRSEADCCRSASRRRSARTRRARRGSTS